MRHTLLCVLGLFLLNNLLHCGHAEDAVLTFEPNRPTFFTGMVVTLTCDIRKGNDTDWSYTFSLNGQQLHSSSTKKSRSLKLMKSHSGEYQCTGRHKSTNLTVESNHVTLNVSDKPKPVLTVSPLWLSPGASVTLKCEVKHPSERWTFYWYKALPDLSGNYSYELLLGSTNGTEQDSYVVHGQTLTAGYVCRAKGGDSVYYTQYSRPNFVWSGDFHPASVKVSPDKVQHFSSDSVSLKCEGNSPAWRVRRFSESGYLSSCSEWGTAKGSTCNIHRHLAKTAVFWCETASGQFSNAVNITGQSKDIILVSPAHLVTEGESVILGCKSRNATSASKVLFYRNGDLIQSDSRWELKISAVSKSDEGFYKCRSSDAVSPQSWVAVKSSRTEHSSSPLPLIIGSVCGVLLIILLLLLCCCRKSKNSYFARTTQSQRTNQSSVPDQLVNQDETQREVRSSHLHGDACLYESIDGPQNTENDADVTYSLIQLKQIKGQRNKPEESSVYSKVKTGAAAGKSSADETVYSEVRLGTPPGP